MREEILSIASDLREGFMTTNDAKEQLIAILGTSESSSVNNSESQCEYCTEVSGMYLGMTCPGCNRSFRSVKQEAYVHFTALSKFDDEYSWEHNLDNVVRWNSEEAEDDVSFYVKHWLEKIADQEGYKLVSKK